MLTKQKQNIHYTVPKNVTQQLYLEFVEGKRARSGQAFASSHWEYYRSLFRIDTNNEGMLESIEGEGFGSCRWRSFGHRVLDNLCVLSHLFYLPNRIELFDIYLKACRIAAAMGLSPTLDVFRQACTLWIISKYLQLQQKLSHIQMIVIGDGYGVFSSLFMHHYPDCGITLVDLPETLMVQSLNCQKACPNILHAVIDDKIEENISGFRYCTPDKIERLSTCRFHLAVNVASFQEMTNKMIGVYFDLLRSTMHHDNLFYCCNREKKVLPAGEITQINQYPWTLNDKVLLDEKCPWYRYFFGKYPSQYGFTIRKFRVPFVNYYDGKIIHKMVKIEVNRNLV